MIALGFDTSTRATAVGLRLADATTLQARDDPAPGEHPGHATRLLGMADALLSQAHLPWTDLQRIAVGLGPGRFTGLRVGVATARGLAQSLAVSLVGVPTLRALAEPALASGPGNEQVLAVIDALRGEVFLAGYRAVAGGSPQCALAVPQPLARNEIADALRSAAPPRRWLAVGDGAVRYRLDLEAAGALVPADGSSLHLVQGGTVCELGARGPAASAHEQVVPDYRRLADARMALATPRPAGGAARPRQPGPRVGSRP